MPSSCHFNALFPLDNYDRHAHNTPSAFGWDTSIGGWHCPGWGIQRAVTEIDSDLESRYLVAGKGSVARPHSHISHQPYLWTLDILCEACVQIKGAFLDPGRREASPQLDQMQHTFLANACPDKEGRLPFQLSRVHLIIHYPNITPYNPIQPYVTL